MAHWFYNNKITTRFFSFSGRLREEEGVQVFVLQEADRPEGRTDDRAKTPSDGKRFPSGMLQMRGGYSLYCIIAANARFKFT